MIAREWNAGGALTSGVLAGRLIVAAAVLSLSVRTTSVRAEESTDAPPSQTTEVADQPLKESSGESGATEDSAESPENAVQNPHSVAMTAIHNYYRAQAGLPPQTVDQNLTNVAQHWANHMASVGSMYHGPGEQIIAYSGGDRSYEAGFQLWLGSPPHRSWLCSRGDLCGFGYAIGRDGCAYYAGAFGSSPVTTASSPDGTVQQASYTQAAEPAVSQSSDSGYYYNYNYSNGGRRRFRRR